jgi:hypothetical protein
MDQVADSVAGAHLPPGCSGQQRRGVAQVREVSAEAKGSAELHLGGVALA